MENNFFYFWAKKVTPDIFSTLYSENIGAGLAIRACNDPFYHFSFKGSCTKSIEDTDDTAPRGIILHRRHPAAGK